MQEGETGSTLEKRHDRGTGIEAVLVRAPRLQRTAGHVKPLGRLTLGDTLGVQITIPRKQVSAFEARPALVTSIIATLRVLDDRCHRYLLFQPFALQSCWLRMARELSGFNPYSCRVAEFLGCHLD
jgi:hypothetical protein